MHWGNPFLLILLVPLFFLWWRFHRKTDSSSEKKRLPLLVAAVTSLVVASAGPYWRTIEEKQIVKGLDLIVILDVSQSMFCEDGTPRRIDQARQFLRSLLSEFTGSSIALVYFSGDAQIGAPFTNDLRAIHLFLESVSPAMTVVPGSMTAPLEKVLQELVNLSETSPLRRPYNKMALLFSDGEFFDRSSGLEKWLKKQQNFSLYTFVCGTRTSPVPKFDLSGSYPNAYSHIRPDNLMRLASLSGGKSYKLANVSPASIEKELSRNVRYLSAKGKMRPHFQSFPFLLLATVLLIGYQIFPLLNYKPRPIFALLILGLCAISLGMKSPPNISALFSEAVQEAKQKKYDSALKKLKLLQKEGASEETEIAIGNIYSLQEKHDEAIRWYRQALARNPWNSRARWNWEVALKKKSDPNQRPDSNQPPVPPPPAPQIPPETAALLNYFDQLEKEQMKDANSRKPDPSNFAW